MLTKAGNTFKIVFVFFNTNAFVHCGYGQKNN